MRNKEIEKMTTDILVKTNQIINLKDIDAVNEKITEIKELATALEEAVKHINEKMPKGEIWQPQEEQIYYFVDTDNAASFKRNYNTTLDNDTINCGNCYQTEEKAKFEAQREKFTRLFRQYVEQHSEPIDWGNLEQNKWYCAYNYLFNQIEYHSIYYYQHTFQIYASSKEILEDAINFVGEDNFKKYILEIKEEKIMKFKNYSYENYELVNVEEKELSEEECIDLLIESTANDIMASKSVENLTDKEKKLVKKFIIKGIESFIADYDVYVDVDAQKEILEDLVEW